MHYDIESYWSRVANEIGRRESGTLVAGDDDPYYRYKRRKFLRRFLATLDVAGQRVLELGCGPGGNLLELVQRGPASLTGIDISSSMLSLARRTVQGLPVELKKTDGEHLPLEDLSVDTAFTVTVLQHNVDPVGLGRVIAELCRVTGLRIVLFEDTGVAVTASEGSAAISRPVETYRAEFERNGFRLESTTYLKTRLSRWAHEIVRRLLVPANHREGEPLGAPIRAILAPALAITRLLDDVIPEKGDLTRIVFIRA